MTQTSPMECLVWLSTKKGQPEPQLWAEDIYTQGLAPHYRADCHSEIAERIIAKHKLTGTDQYLSLDEAKIKFPPPA